MSRPFDAAVIGSGPNGLVAAIELLRAGRRVVVLEGSDTIGGGARTAALTLPGFRHDVCSSVHPMAIGSPAFQGLEDEGLQWVQPAAACAHPFDDGPAALLLRDPVATGEALQEPRWASWLSPLAERWPELTHDTLAPLGAPASPLLLTRFGVQALLPANLLGLLRLRRPRARALFAGVGAHSVLPLDRMPSAAIGLMLTLAAHAVGWPLPRGGAQSLSDALLRRLLALGGEVRTGTPITSIDQAPTDGPVLFETSPRALVDIAGDLLPASYRRRLLRFRYGPGAFQVHYALAGPIPWKDPAVGQAATVHLGGSAQDLAWSEAQPWKGKVAERPFVLLVQPGVCDDSRAPAGQQSAWAYIHVPPGDPRDHSARLEAQIERYAPGFRDLVLARAVRGPPQMEAYNANYVGGDVNGGAALLSQLFTRPVARWSPYTTPNPRLFLCSASTPPGGGIHGMCGWHAARAALARWPGALQRRG